MRGICTVFEVALVVLITPNVQGESIPPNKALRAKAANKKRKTPKNSRGYKGNKTSKYPVQLGPRPYFVVDSMEESSLKDSLMKCAKDVGKFEKSDWSIGHRGAPMQFPEHTLESYRAALIMGAGIVECDVTFTKDRELICRHDQCDLHTTTDVVTRPELHDKCKVKFIPGGSPPVCCSSDFTLAEVKTLCAKMDASFSGAKTAEEYIGGVADYRTTMYSEECSKVPTHKESIELIMEWGAKFTPELKTPQVDMPFEGDYSQEDFAQQMIDEYIAYDIDPSAVWPQSFLWGDVIYWQSTDYGEQAVALEGTYDAYNYDQETFNNHVKDIVEAGVNILAPPMWMLLDLSDDSMMVASAYAEHAKGNELDIITWTLERSGSLTTGGGWYYQSVTNATNADGDQFELLNALHSEVGILGIFSDWPATTTFFANCMSL